MWISCFLGDYGDQMETTFWVTANERADALGLFTAFSTFFCLAARFFVLEYEFVFTGFAKFHSI